jgi:hypothetical protein
MTKQFRLWVQQDNGEIVEHVGSWKSDWDDMPWVGVQLLLVKLDPELTGKDRVGWYQDKPGLFGEDGYYLWGADDHPTGVTPDAVLDLWRRYSGATNAHLDELTLDDYRTIGVKIGRSIDSVDFDKLLHNILKVMPW